MVESVRDNILLYDLGIESIPPIIIFTEGMIARIIDFEYTYTDGLCGQSFDAKLKLLSRNYNPAFFDPSQDLLRFLISTCYYYYSKHNSQTCFEIRNKIVQSFDSSSSCGKVDPVSGLLPDVHDMVRKNIVDLIEKNGLIAPKVKKWFSDSYYDIISLLLHGCNTPLSLRIERPSYVPIDNFFDILFSMTMKKPHVFLSVLKMIVENEIDDNICKYLENWIDKNSTINVYVWTITVKKSYQLMIPHLETFMYYYFQRASERRYTR